MLVSIIVEEAHVLIKVSCNVFFFFSELIFLLDHEIIVKSDALTLCLNSSRILLLSLDVCDEHYRVIDSFHEQEACRIHPVMQDSLCARINVR